MSNLKETAAQLINKYEKTIFALLQNKPEKDYLYYIVLYNFLLYDFVLYGFI